MKSLTQQLSILALATMGTACTMTPTTPLRDFNKLSGQEQMALINCATSAMPTISAERIDKELARVVAKTPNIAQALRDPVYNTAVRAGISGSLAQKDCAKPMNVDTTTLPRVEVEILRPNTSVRKHGLEV